MIKPEKILLFIFFVCIAFAGNSQTKENKEVIHQLRVLHPGVSLTKKVPCKLIEVQNPAGYAEAYYMDVQSVFCDDHQCKIVPVRIYWDVLGFYDRFELKPGIELEKAEGKAFTSADYKKLQIILSDKKSPLRDVYEDEIVENGQNNTDVDAMTGATVAIADDAVVKGAAWTCYTLWYWANGEIFQMMRQITANECTEKNLIAYLTTSNNERAENFGLEQLARRDIYHDVAVNAVLMQAESKPTLVRPALQYLEKASATTYFPALLQLFKVANNDDRLLYLRSLLATNKEAPPDYFDWFSHQLLNFKSYQEVQLLFTLINKKDPNSTEAVKLAAELLKNDNLLVARSAYWFLKDKALNNSVANSVMQFQAKNKGKL